MGVLCTCVFLPRLVMTLVTLWLGCRWLVATTSFSELILNSMALEFLLDLKNLLYKALAPIRSRCEVEKTRMLPLQHVVNNDCRLLLAPICWGAIGTIWAALYMFRLQQVLPQYNWDIYRVCQPWLLNEFSD